MKELKKKKDHHFEWKDVEFKVQPIPVDHLFETNMQISYWISPDKKDKLKKAYQVSQDHENLNLEHNFDPDEKEGISLTWYFHERDINKERLIVRATHVINDIQKWAA